MKTKAFHLCFIRKGAFIFNLYLKMGAIEIRAKAYAAQHGLTGVRFHKKWHKFDVYTAIDANDLDNLVYFLVDDDQIRMATPAETDRFIQGHHVVNDMP